MAAAQHSGKDLPLSMVQLLMHKETVHALIAAVTASARPEMWMY